MVPHWAKDYCSHGVWLLCCIWCHLGPWYHWIVVEKGDVSWWSRTPVYWTKAQSVNLWATEALVPAIDFWWLVSWVVVRLSGLCLLFRFLSLDLIVHLNFCLNVKLLLFCYRLCHCLPNRINGAWSSLGCIFVGCCLMACQSKMSAPFVLN